MPGMGGNHQRMMFNTFLFQPFVLQGGLPKNEGPSLLSFSFLTIAITITITKNFTMLRI